MLTKSLFIRLFIRKPCGKFELFWGYTSVMYPRTALCVGRGFARLSSLAGSTHTLCPLSRGSLL